MKNISYVSIQVLAKDYTLYFIDDFFYELRKYFGSKIKNSNKTNLEKAKIFSDFYEAFDQKDMMTEIVKRLSIFNIECESYWVKAPIERVNFLNVHSTYTSPIIIHTNEKGGDLGAEYTACYFINISDLEELFNYLIKAPDMKVFI